jgi:cytoskeletal protein CcmA (bactofilin family)
MAVFGKKQKDLMDSHISTIISDGCIIDGNLTSTSSVRIDGLVNGNVQVQQGVIVGNSGKVMGNVRANEAVIFGEVNGNITVEKLEIKTTGKITGDISTQAIEMEFGAVYNGKVSMNSASTSSNYNSKKTTQEENVLMEN